MSVEVYRCVKCHHGQHLTACAAAVVSGPLGADGELAEHQAVEEAFIHEDSIQCERHLDGVIEKRVDGVWCRWWSCPSCGGIGKIGTGPRTYYSCQSGGPDAAHRGWTRTLEGQQ